MVRTFGKQPRGNRLQRIKNSPHYLDGSFKNCEKTEVKPDDVSMFNILRKMAFRPSSVRPSKEIPNLKTDLHTVDPTGFHLVWFGHSSYFIDIHGFRVLVDPVFSGNASPFRFFGKAFRGSNHFNAEDIPPIDLLILTHDHYDHLDFPSITKLKSKVSTVVTPIGVGEHLESWGVKKEKIIELDWWEEHEVREDVKITATPSRHFSGRSIKRAQTLWSSFVLEINQQKIFIGGDSGYDRIFQKIGDKFGPFDLVFLECGQFSTYWPQIHMFPEQTVQAAIDLKAKITIPVHWGKFVLSHHPWNEPIQRFNVAAKKANLNFIAPKIGEAVDVSTSYNQDLWWLFENKNQKHERESATLG